MRHDDERIDLSVLDPENDPDRLERVTAGILDRLGPGIVDQSVPVRYQVPRLLARRFQTLLATASLVAAVAAILLARSIASPDAAPATAASAIVGVPDEWAAWLLSGSAPRAENLLFLVSGENR